MNNISRLILLAAILSLLIGGVMLVKARIPRRIHNGPTLTLDLGKGITIDLIRIQPGEFDMGSDDSEEGHDPSESPRHHVKIDKPFYLGKFEVTQGQYEAIMGINQSQLKGPPETPADSIAWVDAKKFCRWASERTGRTFRLPSEAEWEYACRAGTTTPFSTGDQLTPADAVFNYAKSDPSAAKPDRPAPGGSKKPNAWGLYDMHGDLWEWCQDSFQKDYTTHPGTQAPVKSASADADFVYRGGSWRSGPEECRSAVRFAGSGDLRSDVMGFRVVVEAQ